MKNKMKVEIWSDVMCPYCYIGKRRFEHALDQFPHKDAIQVIWKSFQLNPNLVTNPEVSVKEHLAQSKGWTLEYTQQMTDYVMNMAKGEGLIYDFDNAVLANSFKAHRLLQFAKTKQKGDALKEALLKAYFIGGKNTDDDTELLKLGLSVGLAELEVKNVLQDSNAFALEVHNDIQEARTFGVSGVPFFAVDRKYGISGAQDSKAMLQTLEKAYGEWESVYQEALLENIEGPICSPDGHCE